MSPEQWEGKLSCKSDIWSFGCMLIELFSGQRPYHDIGVQKDDALKIMKLVMNKVSPLDYIKENYREDFDVILNDIQLLKILMRCFFFAFNLRPSAKELLSTAFFRKRVSNMKTFSLPRSSAIISPNKETR